MTTARIPPLRVLHLIDRLSWGGAESLLSDLATAAPQAGIGLGVAYLQDRDGSPSAARLRRAGVEPVLLDTGRLAHPRSLRAVAAAVRRARPDLVHTHLSSADVLGGLAARGAGVPAVSTVHLVDAAASDLPGLRGELKRRLTTRVRDATSARVLTVSEAAREAYLGRSGIAPERLVTVHNGIAAAAPARSRQEVRAELGVHPDALLAVTVSVLRPGKGHDVAFEAVRRLREAHPSLVLLVLGDGPSRAELERLAAPLGPLVRFAGHRDDVLDVLGAADVLVHPTLMDAFPTSLLEAAAAGTPVVATAVGGIPEIVQDESSGLLIPEARADALADALDRLLGDGSLRATMGAAGAERFTRSFTAAAWAGRLRAVYDEVLDEHAGGAATLRRPRRPRAARRQPVAGGA